MSNCFQNPSHLIATLTLNASNHHTPHPSQTERSPTRTLNNFQALNQLVSVELGCWRVRRIKKILFDRSSEVAHQEMRITER